MSTPNDLPLTDHPAPARRRAGVFVAVAAAAAGISVGGCTFESPPTLSVASADVIETTPEGAAFEFNLLARNENEIELPLREFRYRLDVDGKTVFTGVRSPEAVLGAFSVQPLMLPASVAWGDLPADAGPELPFRLSGELLYVTPGRLAETFFDTGVRRPSADFTLEGVLPRPSRPSSAASTRID